MGSSLRVFSANLWKGRADPDALADLVRSLDPDVVAVQELGHDQADALSRVMPHGELQPDTRFDGTGILMRHPGHISRMRLANRIGFDLRIEPEAWPSLETKIPVHILNVHIAAPHSTPPPHAFWKRGKQVKQVTEHLQCVAGADSSAAQVVVGDFNATPLWPVYWRMASQLTDAAVAAAEQRGRSPRATWGPWAGSPRLLRIDHGFVRGLQVDEFEVVEVSGSDHSAIVMDFSLP